MCPKYTTKQIPPLEPKAKSVTSEAGIAEMLQIYNATK